MADDQVLIDMTNSLLCESCGCTDDVVWYCKNCPGALCTECRIKHGETSLTEYHVIVPYSKAADETICPRHPDKVTMYYCKDCKVHCCVKCVEEQHLGHGVRMGDTALIQQTKEFQEKENAAAQRQAATLSTLVV